MKKFLILACLVIASTTAMAFQTPAQQGANAINAVVQSILSDNGLQLLSITKINVSTSGAKAQLVNQNGECMALPYVIKTDALGTVSAEINKAALATCD